NHPEKLQELVLEKNLDIGLAFDGDGDRLIAVDEKGNIVDGDQIMYICATYLHERKQLHKDTVVSTVMSNIGFHQALKKKGIHVVSADVGDRYVMEKMLKGEYNFGGEQSGHIIFLNHTTSGDGMLTAIQLINIMKETGKSLSELAEGMTVYPQTLKNVRVINKEQALNNSNIVADIERVKDELGDKGRVLVRPSGTESLIRVMVEAESKEECEKYADQLVKVIEE